MTNYDILKEYEAHQTPVPSYKEYTSLVNWKEDLTELCTAKERIIEKYENIDTWWQAEYTELKEQNAQLKKLLKECKKMLMQSNYQNMTQYHEVLDMRDKIDEVLGEK